MSNQQWNSGSNEWPKQPEGNEWGAPQQQGQPAQHLNQQGWQNQGSAQDWPQAPAQEWPQAQPSAQDWNQAQPQPSAADAQPGADWDQQQAQAAGQEGQAWGAAQPQQGAQDWNQPAAGQDWQPQRSATEWQNQPSAQDWNQQPQQSAQDWNQATHAAGQDWGQQGGQDWNQGWQQGGAVAPGAFQGQHTPAKAKGNPFDFSFKPLSLHGSAGLIFILGVVAVGVEWLFSAISMMTADYIEGFTMFQGIVTSLASALFKILVLRVLIEIGVALTRKDDTPTL